MLKGHLLCLTALVAASYITSPTAQAGKREDRQQQLQKLMQQKMDLEKEIVALQRSDSTDSDSDSEAEFFDAKDNLSEDTGHPAHSPAKVATTTTQSAHGAHATATTQGHRATTTTQSAHGAHADVPTLQDCTTHNINATAEKFLQQLIGANPQKSSYHVEKTDLGGGHALVYYLTGTDDQRAHMKKFMDALENKLGELDGMGSGYSSERGSNGDLFLKNSKHRIQFHIMATINGLDTAPLHEIRFIIFPNQPADGIEYTKAITSMLPKTRSIDLCYKQEGNYHLNNIYKELPQLKKK